MTEYGPTNNYSVKDGLDQGETYFPILWRIFYDPLLCEIKNKHQKDGYIMHKKWLNNITDNTNSIFTYTTNYLAFIDDTAWIANSETSVQNIIETVYSFFDIVDIEINLDKTEIIRISKKNQTYKSELILQNNKGQIKILALHQSARYLGVWIRSDGKSNTVINMIENELKLIYQILSRKHITDKQTAYIFNSVISPAIEYRSMITYITASKCKK